MAATTVPVYFELSWSILSLIGAVNVVFGVMVAGIAAFSQIIWVPIVTSAAGAVANGLCYYAFYHTGYSATNRAVASVFGDLAWLIQEAGLSFYSYTILSRILRSTKWIVFAALFWTIMVAIVAVRIFISVTRVRYILGGQAELQDLVNKCHIGYFTLIAAVECLSAYFLLLTFANVRRASREATINSGLFRYLMRSTEIRLAGLAVIGVMRAVTYSFQASAQSATNTASQLDRFAYTLECLFPIVMLIDILASRLLHSSEDYGTSRSQRELRGNLKRSNGAARLDGAYGSQRSEHMITIQGGTEHSRRTSSQEDMIDKSANDSPVNIKMGMIGARGTGISKTVEFEVYESEHR